ncbi:hypothetical protein [Streptomyces sp. NPDC003077]|uniref:DUF7848 domain-containing protein n=1 Tax=Streptomyces sp. NPDC003077 TaxID=3154443 RepID=UPI0033A1B85D
MARVKYRFRDHTLRPDETENADPVLCTMECKGCGETSEGAEYSEDGTQWAAVHLKAHPGHLTYREHITRPYRFEPGAWR